MTVIKITHLPLLNSVVVTQKGGHFFIAAKDSIIIDEIGLIKLIVELGKIGFLSTDVLQSITEHVKEYLETERKVNENSKDTGDSS